MDLGNIKLNPSPFHDINMWITQITKINIY